MDTRTFGREDLAHLRRVSAGASNKERRFAEGAESPQGRRDRLGSRRTCGGGTESEVVGFGDDMVDVLRADLWGFWSSKLGIAEGSGLKEECGGMVRRGSGGVGRVTGGVR